MECFVFISTTWLLFLTCNHRAEHGPVRVFLPSKHGRRDRVSNPLLHAGKRNSNSPSHRGLNKAGKCWERNCIKSRQPKAHKSDSRVFLTRLDNNWELEIPKNRTIFTTHYGLCRQSCTISFAQGLRRLLLHHVKAKVPLRTLQPFLNRGSFAE